MPLSQILKTNYDIQLAQLLCNYWTSLFAIYKEKDVKRIAIQLYGYRRIQHHPPALSNTCPSYHLPLLPRQGFSSCSLALLFLLFDFSALSATIVSSALPTPLPTKDVVIYGPALPSYPHISMTISALLKHYMGFHTASATWLNT